MMIHFFQLGDHPFQLHGLLLGLSLLVYGIGDTKVTDPSNLMLHIVFISLSV